MLAQATSGQLNRDFLLHLLGPLQPLLQESAAAIGIALYTLFLQPYAISVFRFMRHHIHLVLTRKQSSGLVEHVDRAFGRSEEHTSELQSLMRISYAVFCLKKTKLTSHIHISHDYYS